MRKRTWTFVIWPVLLAALVLMLAGVACVPRPTPPVVAPQPCPLVVSVYRGDPALDHKVAGAAVELLGPGTTYTGVTDGAGNLTLALPMANYAVSATAAGYTSASTYVHACSQVTVGLVLTRLTPDPVEPPTPPAPHYRVITTRTRLDHRAFVDELGPRPRIGVSLFWLAWGYKHDRPRVAANLKEVADRGGDFVRAWGEVCGGPWIDREVRPDWPDYADVIRGSTRLAMSYGLRVEWTLFAGGCYDTPAAWLGAADRMIDALQEVVHGVQLVEVTNEQQLPSPPTVRDIARRVRDRLGVVVALSGTPEKELPALYAGSAAMLGTVHLDRQDGDFGWRFARQAWGYWDLPSMPPACGNNEPAGLASSVRAENDPLRLASDALVTWIAGCAYYVVHTGAGVYGRDYDHAVGHRYANLWEQPGWAETMRLVTRVRDALPGDIANWTRVNNHWTPPNPVPPFRFRQDDVGDGATRALGVARAFTAQRDGEFWTVILGARGDLGTTTTRPFTATVRELRAWTETPWAGTLVGADSTYLVHGR